MQNGLSFDDICEHIVSDYFNTIDYPRIQFVMRKTDDMKKSYLELCSEQAKESVQGKNLNDYNGIMVPPKDLYGTFYFLLNVNKLTEYLEQNNPTWIGTIVHEITHIIDYIEYAKLIGANNYDEIQNRFEHGMFNLWTEFNARYNGYYFMRKNISDNISDPSFLHDIFNKELPAQIQMLADNYKSTNDGYLQAYYVSHYLGRLFALQKIFPSNFDNQTIKAIIGENEWMYEWFVFLSTHTDLKDAYEDFEDMKNILRKNFKGL